MKTCKNCGVPRELEEFNSNGYSKKGTKLYKPICKYCDRLIKKNKYQDVVIMIRGKPLEVPSEYKKKVRKQALERGIKNKEKKNESNRKRWQSLSKEEQKRRSKQARLRLKQKLLNKE